MLEERELTQSEAQSRLNLLCRHLGISAKVTAHATTPLVASCTLFKESTPVSTGAGKGQACQLGALAESLEHYLLEDTTYNQPLSCTGESLRSHPAHSDDWLIQSIPVKCELEAYRLDALDKPTNTLVPATLLSPFHSTHPKSKDGPDTAFLSKYSTNSGTAIGCTEQEALLHAINESIERHALSHYYLAVCGLSTPLKLNKPADRFLAEALSHDSDLYQYSLSLDIHITNTFYGGYFCVALPRKTEHAQISIIGSGYSISASTALYRAVTEQLQCQTLRTQEDLIEDSTIYEVLSSSSRLSKLIHPCVSKSLEPIHPRQTTYSVMQQIRQALFHLHRNGRTVFYRNLFHLPELACVTQVYIPGLDRFHLIRSGIPVIPQSALSNGRRSQHVYL